MKKILLIPMLAAVAVFASCKKEKDTTIDVTFKSVSANGLSGETTTSALTLTFSAEIKGLSADDIAIVESTVTKGALTAKGNGVYELALAEVKKEGPVTVKAGKSGCRFSPVSQTVTVFFAEDVEFLSAVADGQSKTATTSTLTLTFSKDIEGLTADDITITGTAVTKGALTAKSKKVYELALTDIQQEGPVTLTVAKRGYTITPASQTVDVCCVIDAGFLSLTANGQSNTVTSKTLTLTFDKDIEGLSAGDIDLQGAEKGELTAKGGGVYELAVGGIAAERQVAVSVSKSGYAISPALKTATVYAVPAILREIHYIGSETAVAPEYFTAFRQYVGIGAFFNFYPNQYYRVEGQISNWGTLIVNRHFEAQLNQYELVMEIEGGWSDMKIGYATSTSDYTFNKVGNLSGSGDKLTVDLSSIPEDAYFAIRFEGRIYAWNNVRAIKITRKN